MQSDSTGNRQGGTGCQVRSIGPELHQGIPPDPVRIALGRRYAFLEHGAGHTAFAGELGLPAQ